MPGHEINDATEQLKRQTSDQQRQHLEQRVTRAQDVAKPGERQAVAPTDGDARIVDRFTDKAGREMSVRRTMEEDRNGGGSRFYELLHQGNRAGRMSLEMQRSHEFLVLGKGSPGEYERVRIVDIVVDPPYQDAGSSRQLLAQAEKEATHYRANEIHGAVTDQKAESYWRHMAKEGWQLRHAPGEGLSVHKLMSN
ncbi:MAG: hypothetical protein IAE81_21650 [Caldilineaceae bacterium]|nr:hypothetical protein [Caldilineaceae bacterium]